MNTSPNYWKWSCGEPAEKSRRNKNTHDRDPMQNHELMNDSATSSSSVTGYLETNNDRSYKRDNCNSVFMERSIMTQHGHNPYIQTNYIENLMVQDAFLKPQNSSYVNESKP